MTQMEERKTGSREQTYIALAFLALIAIAVYLNSVFGDFVLDDEVLIQKNRAIRSLWDVRLLTYRWVRTFSYALDYYFWGLEQAGYHLSNILYNTLTVIVVFLLTRRLSGIFTVSFVTALLFAVHPIHTEAVSYLSGRRDILSALFYLAGFYAYLKVRESGKWRGYLLVLLCYIAGISSKEMAVTLPLLIFAYELLQTLLQYKEERHSLLTLFLRSLGANLKRFRLAILLFLAVMSGYLYMVIVLQKASGMVTLEYITWWGGSPAANFATVACVISAYLKKLIFPVVLHVDYHQFPRYMSFLQRDVLLSAALILGSLGFSLAMVRRNWRVTFLIWFFFITLLPVMHIIPHHILMAEHYLYLPSYAFCLAGAYSFQYIYSKPGLRTSILVLLFLLSGVYYIKTVDRNSDWTDIFTLMRNDLKTSPDNPVYHFFLGRSYNTRHLSRSASGELELALSENYIYSKVHATRAVIAYSRGDYEEGERDTEKALSLDPRDPMALYNRGLFALLMGDKEKALKSYSAIEPFLEDGSHLVNMASIYLEKRDLVSAEREILRGLEFFPDHPGLHYQMAELAVKRLDFIRAEKEYGTALGFAGSRPELGKHLSDIPEKIRWLEMLRKQYGRAEEVLSRDPGGAEGHRLLGEVYSRIHEDEKAENELRSALKAEEKTPESEALLAKVLARRGNNAEAEALFGKLLDDPLTPPSLLAEAGEYFAGGLKLQRALQAYRKAAESDPGNSRFKARLDELRKIAGLMEQSRLLEEEGHDAASKVVRGDLFTLLGKAGRAIEAYESAAMKLPSGGKELRMKLFDLYDISGYPYLARFLETGRRIMEMDPADSGVSLRLARKYYIDVGDYESALEYYEKALAVSPGLTDEARIRRTVETLRKHVQYHKGDFS